MVQTVKALRIPSEKSRYITGWIIISIVIISAIFAITYNFSAILMLFNKGEISLRSYSSVIETVEGMDDYFSNISISNTDEQSGQIYYETQDGVGQFWVEGSDDYLCSVRGDIYISAFSKLDILRKYESIDSILRAICKDSDILTAEIALIKLFSRYAFSTLTARQQWSQTTQNENITIEYNQNENAFKFYIELKNLRMNE